MDTSSFFDDSFNSFSIGSSSSPGYDASPAVQRGGGGLGGGGMKRSGALSSLHADTSISSPSAHSSHSLGDNSDHGDSVREKSPVLSTSTHPEVRVDYPLLTTRQGGMQTPRRPTTFGLPGLEGCTPGRVVSYGKADWAKGATSDLTANNRDTVTTNKTTRSPAIEQEAIPLVNLGNERDLEREPAQLDTVAVSAAPSDFVEPTKPSEQVAVEDSEKMTAPSSSTALPSPFKTEEQICGSPAKHDEHDENENASQVAPATPPIPSVEMSHVKPDLVDDPAAPSLPASSPSPLKHSPAKEATSTQYLSPDKPVLASTPSRPRMPSSVPSSRSRVISKSFDVPDSHELSLIGDCRPPSCAGDVTDDSFDFAIEELRPMTARKARLDLEAADALRGRTSLSPTKPAAAQHSMLSPSQPSPRVPAHEKARLTTKATLKTANHPPPTSSRSKRTFPASASAQSLASVDEEAEMRPQPPPPTNHNLDVSTFLPSSPAKMQHLLRPEAMIKNEWFHLGDGPSIIAQAAHRPVRSSPLKPVIQADTTLDIRDLMAKMAKPKRASGTEESFEDLLHGQPEMDASDMYVLLGCVRLIARSMMGADEPLVPATLRPPRHLLSPTQHVASPRKSIAITRSNSTKSVGSGVSPSSGSLLAPASVRKARRRSKSLSETESAGLAAVEAKSPAKIIRSPMPTQRTRPSALPAPGSRRISLSAGAVVMPKSASLKRVELPGQKASTAATRADRIAPLPTSTSLARRGSVAPASALSRRTSTLPGATAAARPRLESTPASTASRTSVAPNAPTSAMPLPSATTRTAASRPVVRPAPFVPKSCGATEATSRLSRPVRPAGLPLPASDGSARSAPLTSRPAAPSREFGSDGSRTANRLARPAASTATNVSSGLTRPIGSKLSAGPGVPPSKAVARPSTTVKSRALSTPASVIARGSTAVGGVSRKASVPPERVAGSSSTGLPRPATSRTPASAQTPGKMSTSASMADIRARLDKLQARQAVGRR